MPFSLWLVGQEKDAQERMRMPQGELQRGTICDVMFGMAIVQAARKGEALPTHKHLFELYA